MAADLHVILITELKEQVVLIPVLLHSGEFKKRKNPTKYRDFWIIHTFFNNNRVTLILYQNIVPISLYISVEIVKTLAVSKSRYANK
jgi:magnesium-transporting ATPase (P-type)